MTKQEMAVTMAEFVSKYSGYVQWTPRKVEKMAQDQFAVNQDLLISTEEYLFRISADSIGDYFKGASEPVKQPVVETTMSEPPKAEIVDTPAEPIVATRKAGRPKKEV